MPNNLTPVVDTETTGLDLDADRILEVGMAIVNIDTLEILDSMSFVLSDQNPGYRNALSSMSDFVYDMHEKSGLLQAIHSPGAVWLQEASERMDEFLTAYYGHDENNRPPMLGSSVHFDREMLRQTWPEIEERFFYRNIDVSSIKELCARWNPELYAKLPAASKEHRVMADIGDTLTELKFYRDNFLFLP